MVRNPLSVLPRFGLHEVQGYGRLEIAVLKDFQEAISFDLTTSPFRPRSLGEPHPPGRSCEEAGIHPEHCAAQPPVVAESVTALTGFGSGSRYRKHADFGG